MGQKVTVIVEAADRGNVVRVVTDYEDRLEILEGVQGSVNLRDRTRRRIAEIAASAWPSRPDATL
jgi:hypothetical protein